MKLTHPLIFALAALMCALGACSSGANRAETTPAAGPAAANLPAIGALDALVKAPRNVDENSFELLNYIPAQHSDQFESYSQGELSLTPSEGQLGWALFALGSFPTDGTVYPTLLSIQRDQPCWLAVADYAEGGWRFLYSPRSGDLGLPDGTDLVSPLGNCFVAVIAYDWSCEVTSLRLHTNAELPGGPTAVLTVPDNITEEYPAKFSAENSSGGDGTITQVTYDFGDGSAPVVMTDKSAVVTHTYQSVASFEVTLTVRNDRLREDTQVTPVEVAEVCRDLLIIYNSDMPDDLDLANYYSSPETGRGIDPVYRLGLALGENAAETISRADYGSKLRDPILAFIDDPANEQLKGNIKYLLLLKGVPYKIPGSDGGAHSLSTNTCVDSELCLLRSGGVSSDEGYRIEGPIWDAPEYYGFDVGGFYNSGDVSFTPDEFQVTDLNGAHWPLNYLVCRISAYTYDDCKAMIDRSLNADTSGEGWTVLDTNPGSEPYERMFDPVWPNNDDTWDSGIEIFTNAGCNVVGDDTSARITAESPAMLDGPANNMMVYCSWGVHAGFGKTYILDTLGFTWLPGACFMSYESYNGQTLRCSNPADPSVGHPGQGQIADFIHMGGTCAIGNVYEPWTDGVGDERWVFNRYFIHGDRWIEAAYKGLCYVSWQEVVIGDPLCRVKAD